MWPLMLPQPRHLFVIAFFLPLLLLLLYFVAKHTDAYEAAEQFVATDARVATSIGHVRTTNFKFWDGFEFTGSDANFSLGALTDKGEFVVEVRLRSATGVWSVETAEVHAHDEVVAHIAGP